jgi:hypothetical protein
VTVLDVPMKVVIKSVCDHVEKFLKPVGRLMAA